VTDRHRVLIRRCDAYDADRIAGIVGEGMQELGARPSGKVLLKPNLVMAHRETFPHAFTRSEFLDGVLRATKANATDVEELAVGERCGIGSPYLKPELFIPINTAYWQMRFGRLFNRLR
jgi:uncharacterized protein (DUF362 family)